MPKSVLRIASALAFTAGAACCASVATADAWLFERIAQTGDPLPTQPSVLITLFGTVFIDGKNVAYSGRVDRAGNSEQFIGALINGTKRRVADQTTPVPDGLGVFSDLGNIHISGKDVLFVAEDGGRGISSDGVYRYRPAAKLHKIVDVGDVVADVPGGTYGQFFGPYADDGRIAYEGFFSGGPGGQGIFIDDDGAQSLALSADSALPDGDDIDKIFEFEFRSGVIASSLRTTQDLLDTRIYRFADDGDERIVSENDFVPDGAIDEVFSIIGRAELDSDGESVFFRGLGDMATEGIYRGSGGIPQVVADTSTLAPPGFDAAFDDFMQMDADNGSAVFTASVNALVCGLYTNLGGSLKSVLDAGDMLDGKVVSFIRISSQSISDRTIAMKIEFDDGSEGVYTATLMQESFETEPNNSPETANCIEILQDPAYISGKLQSNEFPECDPDTVLAAFDKQINFLRDASNIPLINDDDPAAGDGRGSALWDIPFVDSTSDNTRTLRLGVTGAGDIVEGPGGNNGAFNGLLANAPHEQRGEFTLTVTFVDDLGDPLPSPAMLPDGSEILNPISYVEEFQSGGDAFYINFPVPVDAEAAHAVVDNTTGRIDVCNDVDFFIFKNLVPNCPYCVVQVGGLDEDCQQTDLLIAWHDKNGDIIFTDDNSGAGVFAALCDPDLPVVANNNGEIHIAVTGSGDGNFNGLEDGPDEDDYLTNNPNYLLEYPGLEPPTLLNLGQPNATNRLDIVCADTPPAHGVCGCYTLKIFLDVVAHEDPPGPPSIEDAMGHGDINMDGATDTADLGILIGNFGWTAQ